MQANLKPCRCEMSRHSLFAALLLIVSTLSLAQTPRPAAVSAYQAALTTVEQARAPLSLQPLLAAAEAAQDAMMALQADGDTAWIETLSDAEFDALKAELRGFQLSRGYDIYAQPDAAFLYKQARAHGAPEDQAFFQLYNDLWSAELMPRYLSLGNSPTPCVRFGEDILPQLYADWRGYATRYPQAYRAFAQQTVRDLEEVVTLGVCTCSDADSVERELRGFLKRFPDLPDANAVRSRLQELKTDPDLRPVRCR
jgi:hypothetical protein